MRFTNLPRGGRSTEKASKRMTNQLAPVRPLSRGRPRPLLPAVESDDGAEAAKAICAVCPVREPCLEYAITAREKEGVWGGLDEQERRRLIRQRRKTRLSDTRSTRWPCAPRRHAHR